MEIGVSVALPEISDDFGISHGALLWIVAAYLLPLAGLSVVGGRLGDLTSPRLMMWIGGATFTVGAALAAISGSLWLLLLARVTQGVGAALTLPATRAAVVKAYDGEHLGRALGAVYSAGALAVLLSPAILGAVTTAFGWRWIFAVNVVLMPIGAAMATIPHGLETPRKLQAERRSVSWTGAALFSGALVAVTAALFEGPKWGILSPNVWLLVVASVALIWMYVRNVRTDPDPIVPLEDLQSRRAWTGLLTVGHTRFLSAWLATIVPIYLQTVGGLTASTSGLALVPLALVGVGARGVGGWLSDRYPTRRLVNFGLVVSVVGLALASPAFRVGDVWFALVLLMPATAGSTIATMTMRRRVMHDAPEDRVSAVSGTLTMANNVMGLLGLVLIGGVSGHFAASAGNEGSQQFLEASMEYGLLVAAVAIAAIALSAATLRGDD